MPQFSGRPQNKTSRRARCHLSLTTARERVSEGCSCESNRDEHPLTSFMRYLTRERKRNRPLGKTRSRTKHAETLLQTSQWVEEKRARILPAGKISREAMRTYFLRQMVMDLRTEKVYFTSSAKTSEADDLPLAADLIYQGYDRA